MPKSKKYALSVEVYKYPYCGKLDDTQDYLSEKICRYTTKIHKKIVRRAKRVLVYGQLISPLTNGLAPIQAIGLPILPNTPAIMRSIHSNAGFSKKAIIAQVIESNSDRIVLTEKQMDQLYDIAMRCKSNSITSQNQLINELRGGGLLEPHLLTATLIGIIGAVVLTLYLSEGFQVPPNPNIVPPHLEWLYGRK